jgi:hypothetical protein
VSQQRSRSLLLPRALRCLALAGAASGCVEATPPPVAVPTPPIAVTIDGPVSVTLFEEDALKQPAVGPPRATVLCESPCAADIDWRPTKTWWVESKHVERSPLNLRPGYDVAVTIDPGKPGLVAVGAATITGGGLSILTAGLIIYGYSEETTEAFRFDHPAVITAGVLAGLLPLAVAVGAPLIIAGTPRAHVNETPARGAKARAPRYWLGEF